MPGKKSTGLDMAPPPAEDRRITHAARSDPDNFPLTEEELSAMRPAEDILPQVVEAYRRMKRRPRKVQLTLRLDPEIISFFRAGGRGWQTRINAVLREYVEDRRRKTGKA